MLNLKAEHPTDYGTDHPLFWPAACQHCGGDLQLCEDRLGHFRRCVSCSRTASEGLGPNACALPQAA